MHAVVKSTKRLAERSSACTTGEQCATSAANEAKAWTTCTAAVRLLGVAHVAVHVQAIPLKAPVQSHADQSITILAAGRSPPEESLYLFIAMFAHLRAPVTSLRVSEAEASTATARRSSNHSEAPTSSSKPGVWIERRCLKATSIRDRILLCMFASRRWLNRTLQETGLGHGEPPKRTSLPRLHQ